MRKINISSSATKAGIGVTIITGGIGTGYLLINSSSGTPEIKGEEKGKQQQLEPYPKVYANSIVEMKKIESYNSGTIGDKYGRWMQSITRGNWNNNKQRLDQQTPKSFKFNYVKKQKNNPDSLKTTCQEAYSWKPGDWTTIDKNNKHETPEQKKALVDEIFQYCSAEEAFKANDKPSTWYQDWKIA